MLIIQAKIPIIHPVRGNRRAMIGKIPGLIENSPDPPDIPNYSSNSSIVRSNRIAVSLPFMQKSFPVRPSSE